MKLTKVERKKIHKGRHKYFNRVIKKILERRGLSKVDISLIEEKIWKTVNATINVTLEELVYL